MKSKRYNGYSSYQYLDPDDYRQFELAVEIERVLPYRFELTAEQADRVERLIEDNTVISLHEHTSVLLEDITLLRDYEHSGREVTGYRGLAISGMDAVVENFMDGMCTIVSKNEWKWDDVIYDMGMRMCDWAHQDMVFKADGLRDIEYAAQTGRIAVIPALESTTPIENEIDRIDILYGLGVRMLGICYSESNFLGSGRKGPRDAGLTLFGQECVRRMNQLEMAIDVSHASDLTCMDTIELSERPVFISHTGARALSPIGTGKPDEVLKALSAKGGVIGITAPSNSTITYRRPKHDIESVMEHFKYCVDLIGIDHVSFGPDTLFGDHVGLSHDYFDKDLERDFQVEEVPYVAGLENPGGCFPNIVRWLVQHNYSDEDIGKVLGANILGALSEVWVE